MKPIHAGVALAVLCLLSACADTPTAPSDETLASEIAGAPLDPNADVTTRDPTAPAECAYDAASGWITCSPATREGITITRQMQFLDAASHAQARPDALTRSMKSKTTIAGTLALPNGSTTISRSSEETVTGLGPQSTERVVNGTATGSEDTQLKSDRGTLRIKRQYVDTTKNMTFKVPADPASPWPVSGAVVRYLESSSAIGDAPPMIYHVVEARRFEAGGKVTMTTTVNGRTRTCVANLGSNERPDCR